MAYYDQVKEAADTLAARVGTLPRLAVVLGSGLGDFANTLEGGVSIPYDELPNWPASRAIGHQGRLVVGGVGDRIIAALAGRCHAYEGHELERVTFAVRVLGLLGVEMLVLSNAAGGVNMAFAPGALMVIDDHINLMGGNPLVGPNDERFGQRFPDMTEVYSLRLRRIADVVGRAIDQPLPHGVYGAVLGPSYETPAEIRHLRAIGVDAVGMSTVPEAIVARHMGIEVFGVSCITNRAAGILPQPLAHTEVMATTRRVRERFAALLEGIIGRV